MKVDFQDIVDELDAKQKSLEKETKSNDRLATTVGANDAVQKAIIETTKILITFLASHKSTVSVDNHPEPIETVKTPDVDKVVIAVASLEKTIQENHVTDQNTVEAIGNLSKLIEKLPQQITIPETKIPDSVTVKNQVDYSKELRALSDSIQKIDVRPEVTVKSPKVEVKVDQDKLLKAIEALQDEIKNKPVPVSTPTDLTPLIEATKAVQTAVANQQFPIPNYILPFKDINGKATQAQLDADGNLPIASSGSSTPDTPLSTYTYIQKDTSGATYKYYGYADANTAGGWAIKRITIATNLAEFVKGTTGYSTAWTNRASETYSDIWTTF